MPCQSNGVMGVVLAGACLGLAACSQALVPDIEQRRLCEHFRSEPWPEGSSTEDEERRAFIAGQLARHCKGVDQTLGQSQMRRV